MDVHTPKSEFAHNTHLHADFAPVGGLRITFTSELLIRKEMPLMGMDLGRI